MRGFSAKMVNFFTISILSLPYACGSGKIRDEYMVSVYHWLQQSSFFERAFACDVDVELLKSIKMGDNVCLMKITLHDPIWQ